MLFMSFVKLFVQLWMETELGVVRTLTTGYRAFSYRESSWTLIIECALGH